MKKRLSARMLALTLSTAVTFTAFLAIAAPGITWAAFYDAFQAEVMTIDSVDGSVQKVYDNMVSVAGAGDSTASTWLSPTGKNALRFYADFIPDPNGGTKGNDATYEQTNSGNGPYLWARVRANGTSGCAGIRVAYDSTLDGDYEVKFFKITARADQKYIDLSTGFKTPRGVKYNVWISRANAKFGCGRDLLVDRLGEKTFA